jgi:transposase
MDLPVLGIDISKKTFDAALLLADDRVYYRTFPNNASGFDRLSAWLTKLEFACVHACMEATGTYGDALALYLYRANHIVSVVNPRRVRKYAESELRRNKTDKLDAGVNARFCRAQRPEAWAPLADEAARLQALARRVDALQQMRDQENSRLDSARDEMVRSSILEHLRFLDEQIGKSRDDIRAHIEAHPDLRAQRDLLVSIKAIGEKTATAIMAELPNLKEFEQARQAAAFVGLTPRHWQSGTSVNGKPRLSKMGSARLRKALYMPAMIAIRFNPIVRNLARRLRRAGKQEMVIIAAAMHKLIHLAYGVLKTGKPFDPTYARTF